MRSITVASFDDIVDVRIALYQARFFGGRYLFDEPDREEVVSAAIAAGKGVPDDHDFERFVDLVHRGLVTGIRTAAGCGAASEDD